MASRKSLPTAKGILMKKTNLSSTVLDYYNKYGQNRDLEKYLRLRRQNSSKSSSDGSLYNFERTNTAGETERVRKSLQKLNVSEEKDEKVAADLLAQPQAGGASADVNDNDSAAAASDQIKIQKSFRKKSKSKSYNVSMESNIEINMPPPPLPSHSMPELATEMVTVPVNVKQLQFQSCETQTINPMSDEPLQRSACKESTAEQAIAQAERSDEAIVKANAVDECAAETSPASSIASAKMRLEWDSMADVGYNKIIDFKSKSNSNLSTFEKDALTKFFARRGLNFDDNLVIIASPDERTKLQKRKLTQSAIEVRQKSDHENWQSMSKKSEKNAKRAEQQQMVSRSSRGHWKTALLKYQQKYGQNITADETVQPASDSLHLSLPQGHSTPLSIQLSSELAMQSEQAECERVEKSCQTTLSLPKSYRKQSVASVGIQIDIGDEKQEQQPIAKSAPIERVEKSTQSSDPNGTSTASFENVAVDIYTDAQSPASADTIRKETIPPTQNVANDDEENNEEKENVPPIEDKENVPPPKCYSRIEDECVTPEREKSVSECEPLQSSVDDSMMPIELQRGIDLLNALIDSKKLDRDAKKKLTRKIVRRLMKASNMFEIVKLLQKHDDDVEQPDASGVSSASKSAVASDNKTISGITTLSSSETAASDDAAHERTKSAIVTVQKSVKDDEFVNDWLKPATRSEIEKEKRPKTNRKHTEPNANDIQVRAPSNIRQFNEVEKENHFKWIDQEIEHLRNLKMLMTKMDTNTNQPIGPSRSLPERKSLSTYTNMLEKLNEARPATSAVDSNSIKCKSSASECNEIGWTQQSVSSANESDRPQTANSTNDEQVSNRRHFSKWNSHLNMQQLVKNRTKMQTPSSDENFQSYAKARHTEFNRNYAKTQGILYGNANCAANAYEHPIYTKPYSSDDYSDCGNRGLRKILPMKTMNNANAYTSITGSAAFLSSNSVSIALAANSTSNTTTHQYDTRISAGVQTSDTLKRMQPIRMRKSSPESTKHVDELTPTIRVRKFTVNKQQQVRPEPLAYAITFNERVKSGQVDPNDTEADEYLTLQQYLRLRKPEFYSIAEERRRCVNQMHYLRQERNVQRKKLLASYSTSSTLKMNMKRFLPPPPLAQTRLFASKDITANTRRKYRKLPEIVQKKVAEKEHKIRKNHRQLAGIFNKNLQRRVLTGKTDLSNSMTA